MADVPIGSKEQARMEILGKRADSTSAAVAHYCQPTGSGGSGRERPNTIRMTEHELLRIYRLPGARSTPFQDLIPIADEDADLEHASLLDQEPPDGKACDAFRARLRRQCSPRHGDAPDPRADRERPCRNQNIL